MKRLPASECLEKVLSIQLEVGGIQLEVALEKAMQSPSTRNASQLGSGTPTEKASMLTTLMWAPSSKRQRSPHSGCHATFSKKTAIRQKRNDQTESDYSHIYPIADASLWFDGQRGPMYESVLELLKDIQVDGDDAIDSRTSDLVQELCRRFEQLEITEIVKSIDQDTERTILTAVTEERVFELASLTSSHLASSVADLAGHLHHMVELLGGVPGKRCDGHVSHLPHNDGRETGGSSHIWDFLYEVDIVEDETLHGATTPTQAVPFPVVQKSLTWSTIDSLSWQSRSRGLTYPSTVSGCTIPS
jgi:hypothetical protein